MDRSESSDEYYDEGIDFVSNNLRDRNEVLDCDESVFYQSEQDSELRADETGKKIQDGDYPNQMHAQTFDDLFNLFIKSSQNQKIRSNGSPPQRSNSRRQKYKYRKIKTRPAQYNRNIASNLARACISQIKSTDTISEYLIINLCNEFKCSRQSLLESLAFKGKEWVGLHKIRKLMKGDTPQSKIIGIFFRWFFREHYLHYVLACGKMIDLKIYVKKKNQLLVKLGRPQPEDALMQVWKSEME